MIGGRKYPHRVDLHQSSQDYRKGTLPLSNILVHYPLTDVQKFITGEREHSLALLGIHKIITALCILQYWGWKQKHQNAGFYHWVSILIPSQTFIT